MPNTTTEPKHAKAIIARIEIQERELADLKAQLARGTQDHVRPPTIETKIEALLRSKPRTLEVLARELNEPIGRVSTALRPLKKQLFNVGTVEHPEWFWVIGDETPPKDLYNAVEALMRARPFAHAELIAATGARANRVSGAVNEMRRTRPVVPVPGVEGKIRWFILPDGAKIARLVR